MGAGASDARLSVEGESPAVVVAASGDTVSVAVAGTWDVGRELCTPEVGLDPKALLNLALALFIVRSPTLLPPWSRFSFVTWFSSRNLLSASMRSSAVAWRIRPTFRVLRIRERRLRRAVSLGTCKRLPGSAGMASLLTSSSSDSSVLCEVGWRSTRL